MSMLDILTGGRSDDANEAIKNALATIQGVEVPTPESMQFQLQQLVQEGVITPEQAQTFLQSPNAMESMKIDQTGTAAQQKMLARLENIVNSGGRDAQEEADLQSVINNLNTQQRGNRESILQGQAARGALTGGQTLAAQLEANQSGAANANQMALGARASAEQRALQALTTMGQAGHGLQGQQNAQANQVAAATNAINQFNAAQQNQSEQWNKANANNAQAMNLANRQDISNKNVGNQNEYSRYQANLKQQQFNNKMAKANAMAGMYGNQANQYTGQGQQNAAVIGALTGMTGSFFGSGPGGQGVSNPGQSGSAKQEDDTAGMFWASDGGVAESYIDGGPVKADSPEEMAEVPGDSERNDKVPAVLSEGEIVIPRSVANQSDEEILGFLHRMRGSGQNQSHHPEDVAIVLRALGSARNMR